ncbi:MAG: hypothetical protein OXC99_11470 [Chloroflexi bacterium]|nr:hypothetical protein [Chloroflexota bacterium]
MADARPGIASSNGRVKTAALPDREGVGEGCSAVADMPRTSFGRLQSAWGVPLLEDGLPTEHGQDYLQVAAPWLEDGRHGLSRE